jgi:hypothetical protein
MSLRIPAKDAERLPHLLMLASLEAIEHALLSGAYRGLPEIRAATPSDTGNAKGNWAVKRTGQAKKGATVVVAELRNDAPYVGILDKGARPHPVSAEGRFAIERWAKRKFGVSDEEAAGIAWAVARRIKREGQKPTYFARDATTLLGKLMADEANAAIVRVLSQKPRGIP